LGIFSDDLLFAFFIFFYVLLIKLLKIGNPPLHFWRGDIEGEISVFDKIVKEPFKASLSVKQSFAKQNFEKLSLNVFGRMKNEDFIQSE
jgi:hypothetical protein